MDLPRSRSIQGYLLGRTVVLAALLALAALFLARRGGSQGLFLAFFGATGASFAFTLGSAVAVRRRGAGPTLARLQPAWDVAYATALIFLSGGAFSPFVSLYPMAIVGASILLHRKGALAVATASAVAYGVLVDLQFYGVVRPLNPFPLPEILGSNVALQLLFNLVAFYCVALLSGYLAEELRRTGARLEVAEAEVLDLEHLKDSILTSLSSGLVAVDRRGRELFHNQAAEDLLARAGVPLGPGAELSGAFDLKAGERSEARFASGRVTLGYSVSPLFDRRGRRGGSILIFQDVTRVKRLEQDLRRADRLAAVGRLAAGLAHEIRNPLASLAGSVEVLRQGAAPTGDDAVLFEIVLRETERLNRLVTNFLHYARPGRAEPTPVGLRDLVEETGFFFAQGDGRRGFRLVNRVPEGFELQGDRAQLEQLLLNLFRNSLEAAPGRVTVTVDAGVEGDGAPWFAVADDGPGMPSEVAAHAFEPFFTRKPGGTGLGLATVHRIAENHAATAALETGEGRGTTFRFRFAARDP
ncbi:MAG: two-component system sensor histidine kinase NtrB [Deferrisomatales bacterium]